MVEISFRYSNCEGNSVTRFVIDDGFLGVKWPSEVARKREKVGKCKRKRVFEFGKKGIKEEMGWVRKFIEEDALNRW